MQYSKTDMLNIAKTVNTKQLKGCNNERCFCTGECQKEVTNISEFLKNKSLKNHLIYKKDEKNI